MRKEKGITQKELGEKLNVSDKTISRWERGDRIPDSYAIKEISKLLNISCDELLGIKRHEKSKKMYKKFLNKIKLYINI